MTKLVKLVVASVFSVLILFVGSLPLWAASATTTTLSISPQLSVSAGTVLTLTATVKSGGSLITAGQVNFCDASAAHCDNSALIGSAWVTRAGTATMLRALPVGNRGYKAVFTGTKTYSTSTSSTYSVSVTAAGDGSDKSVTISASGTPGNYTLSSTVTTQGGAPDAGTVNFWDTTTSRLLGSAPLTQVATSSSGSVVTWASTMASVNASDGIGFIVADFNGDGILDIAGRDSVTGNLDIYLGNGDGTFTKKASYPVGAWYTQEYPLAVGDFNGDGKLDLVAPGSGPLELQILLGNGDGTFTKKTTLATPSAPLCVSVGDFNGDGIPDIIVGGQLAEYFGNGDGTFTRKAGSTITGGGGGIFAPDPIIVTDFNGDGVSDLLVGDRDSGNLSILLGNGDGTFAEQPQLVYYNPDGIVPFLRVGDFNGDGIPDIFYGAYQTTDYDVLLGKGDGSFTKQAVGVNSPHPDSGNFFSQNQNVWLADVNNDGKADLVFLNTGYQTAGYPHAAFISYMLNNGDGTFSAPASSSVISTGLKTMSIWYAGESGDFSQDGIIDFVDAENGITITSSPTYTGTASLSGVMVPGVGTHYADAQHIFSDTMFGGTSGTVPLTASPIVTGTSLAVSPGYAFNQGTNIQLTATVAPYTGYGYTASGTVTFYDGATSLGSVSISNGQAVISNNSLSLGSHNLTAVYNGDSVFSGSTSLPAVVTVSSSVISTTTSVTAQYNPSYLGNTDWLSATLTSSNGTAIPGTVSFYDGATLLGTSNVNNIGSNHYASWTFPSNASLGTHTITAKYNGSGSYAPSSSNPYSLVVAKGTPYITATTPANPAMSTQDVILYASMQYGGSTGNCSWMSGETLAVTVNGTSVGQIPLTSGMGMLRIPGGTLSAGVKTVSMQYSGDSWCNSATGTYTFSVLDARSTASGVLLTSGLNPATTTAPVPMAAQVLADGPTPTGTATLKEGASTVATGTVASTTGQNLLGPFMVAPGWQPGYEWPLATPYNVYSENDGVVLQPFASTSPVGSQDAIRMLGVDDGNSFFVDTEYCNPNAMHQLSIFARQVTPGQQFRMRLTFYDNDGNSLTTSFSGWLTSGTSWQQFTLSAMSPLSTGYCEMGIEIPTGVSGEAVDLWGPQIQQSSTVGPYLGGRLPGEADTRMAFVAPISAPLGAGTHVLTATYNGNGSYLAGTSLPYTEIVNPGAAGVAASSSKNPSLYGDAVIFTVQITGGGPVPTGTATLTDGGVTLTTVTLDVSGKATYNTSSLAVGDHPIKVTYNGDSNYF
jgi:hypothetical protein